MSAFASSPIAPSFRATRPTPRCMRAPPASMLNMNMNMNMRRALLLVDHGSKRSESNAMLISICDLLRARLPAGSIVQPAHMELSAPSIPHAFSLCVASGATHVHVVPFFLGPGRHVTKDIPRLAAAAAAEHAGVTYEVRPHLGVHESMVDVILARSGLDIDI